MWQHNSCWFDTPLTIKLWCLVQLGVGYWHDGDGQPRAVSTSERVEVDLLCSIPSRTVAEVTDLRNLYMHEFCQESGFDAEQYDNDGYGGFNDCLIQSSVCAHDKDSYHCVQAETEVTYEADKSCACDRMYNASVTTRRYGTLPAAAKFKRDTGEVATPWTITETVNGFLQSQTAPTTTCTAWKAHNPLKLQSLRCRGAFARKLRGVVFGAILVIALKPEIDVLVEPSFVVGGRTFHLVGIALKNRNHYKALLAIRGTGDAKAEWWEYNDFDEQRVKRAKAYTGAEGGFYARAAWYIHKDSGGQPVRLDLSKVSCV